MFNIIANSGMYMQFAVITTQPCTYVRIRITYILFLFIYIWYVAVLFDDEDVQQGSSTTSTDITMMTEDTRIQVNWLIFYT